jgi:hypothetical protein
MWETRAIRATVPLVLGSEPCHVRLWWNAPPPGFTTTGTISISASAGLASRTPANQSSGAWNCDRSGGVHGQWLEPRT